MLDAPLDDRIAHDSHTVGVGDHHRAFEKSRLFDPRGAGHLAIAVQRIPAREDRIVDALLAARQDGRHSGAHRALPDHQLARTRDQRREADFDTSDIGDGVERAGCAVERDAEIAGARLGLGERKDAAQEDENEHRGDASGKVQEPRPTLRGREA